MAAGRPKNPVANKQTPRKVENNNQAWRLQLLCLAAFKYHISVDSMSNCFRFSSHFGLVSAQTKARKRIPLS